MLPRFEAAATRGKYAPAAYRNEVQAMVRVLQDRYGLSKREDADSQQPRSPPALDQAGRAGRVRLGLTRRRRRPASPSIQGSVHGSTTSSPSRATTWKCELSFQRSLIGSLMRSSMTRFRNRAPNARL